MVLGGGVSPLVPLLLPGAPGSSVVSPFEVQARREASEQNPKVIRG
jgi:hypothetical protein